MKILKYYKLMTLMSLFFIISCNDTFEIHKEYAPDGEVIYTSKVDSMTVLSGNGRIKITGFITNAFNVNEIVVKWNKGKESKSFPYTKSANDTDMFELIVDGLGEQTLPLDVYSKDTNNNWSIKQTVFGTSFGELFRSNLSARSIKTFALDVDGNALVTLNIASDVTRVTTLKYTNLTGAEVMGVVSNLESEVTLMQVDTTKPILYSTNYVSSPANAEGNETTIDEYASDWVTFTAPVFLNDILETVNFVSKLGGATASWTNTDAVNVELLFTNMVGGAEVTSNTSSNAINGSYTVAGMETGEQEIKLVISDIYGNSWTKAFTVTALEAVVLDKSGWSIESYSSEEPKEANWGPPIQGTVPAVIDGDVSTFWHSQWDLAQPDYPHSFIIDLGALKTIGSVELFRRQGAGNGASKHEIWVSVDNTTYTKEANYDSQIPSNDGLTISIPSNPKVRYIKYVATEGPGHFTHLSEFNASGIE